MTFFFSMCTAVLMWAWLCPHDVGVWVAKFRDPYREKPRHKEDKK